MDSIRFIVFDVGGVLVRLAGAPRLIEWTGSRFDSVSDLHHAWVRSPAVQRFERGESKSRQFAREIIDEMSLPTGVDEFIDEFKHWPGGLLPGARELLELARGTCKIGCLTNTNELHWPHQMDADYLHQVFDRNYVSYEMGMVKPDPEIFDAVSGDLGIPPVRILFFDDNRINVEAAIDAGFRAHLVDGVEETRELLSNYRFTR